MSQIPPRARRSSPPTPIDGLPGIGALVLILLAVGLAILLTRLPEAQETLAPAPDPPDPDQAEEIFAISPGPLGPLQALEEVEDMPWEKARQRLYLLAGREDAVGYLAALELARQLAEEGLPSGSLYLHALGLYPTEQVRREAADRLLEEGRQERAREQYLALLPAPEAIKGLLLSGLSTPQVMEALVSRSFFRQALELVSDLDAADPRIKPFYLQALLGLGQYGEALEGLRDYHKDNASDLEMGWQYARTLERLGRTDEALSVYEELGSLGDFRRGVILEARGRLREAAEAFSSSSSPEGKWRGAGIWESLGEQERALETYRQLAEEGSAASDDAAFRAVVLLERRGEEGTEDLLGHIRSSPSWMERLGKEVMWRTAPPRQPRTLPHLVRAEAYQEEGREDLAQLEIAIFRWLALPGERLDLGDWYLSQGDHFLAARQGMRTLRDYPCPRAYRLAYPLPFLDIILEAARDYRLKPQLILAVMREESHFRPSVVSWAGAVGLMQVMPETGRGIARQKGLDPAAMDLTDPRTSIRFGAFYLRAMLDSFSGNLDHALAAYNAGPGNAARWVRSPFGSGARDFPRAVTFIETREYITRVRDTMLTYTWLYGDLEGR